ncbi:hypothetical protein [Myxococcus sp. CA039A]|uniref:hypothetical protein n=1 Tax=Myxococcus sp. CA039A TaxID=2741737 RepID=UPI00157B63CF|nr:hypothetical protein [Myxococcus sp. CA039A]NTX52850.1 hypothetical protein [Myxococcus sp. CA039A]
MWSKRWVGVLMMGLMVGNGVACSPLRLAVPETLAREARPVPIERHQRFLGTGGTLSAAGYSALYATDAVEFMSGSLRNATACERKSAYRFTLASGVPSSRPTKVECQEKMTGVQAELEALKGQFTVGRGQSRVLCELEGGGRVELTQSAERQRAVTEAPVVRGQAQVGEVRLSVLSASQSQHGLPVSYLGFHLLRDERTVASVQVVNPATLWMATDLSAEERDAVVLTAFSLMLQRAWTPEGPLDCDV